MDRAGLLASRVRIDCIRIRPWAFPESLPVAEGNFLAYSCAAARDLHPLPNERANHKKSNTERCCCAIDREAIGEEVVSNIVTSSWDCEDRPKLRQLQPSHKCDLPLRDCGDALSIFSFADSKLIMFMLWALDQCTLAPIQIHNGVTIMPNVTRVRGGFR
jgi:hypothetical protein